VGGWSCRLIVPTPLANRGMQALLASERAHVLEEELSRLTSEHSAVVATLRQQLQGLREEKDGWIGRGFGDGDVASPPPPDYRA
jgi:hypothetical protein